MQFNQPDTLIPELYNSLDWNRFSYARYNPVKYSDPSGHSIWDTVGQFATGFVYEFALSMPWATSPTADVLTINQTETTASLLGRVAGDTAAVIAGTVMTSAGATGGALGVTICGTGILSPAGVAIVATSAAAAGVGIVTATKAAGNAQENLANLAGKTGKNALHPPGWNSKWKKDGKYWVDPKTNQKWYYHPEDETHHAHWDVYTPGKGKDRIPVDPDQGIFK
jgi:hypothetical protein